VSDADRSSADDHGRRDRDQDDGLDEVVEIDELDGMVLPVRPDGDGFVIDLDADATLVVRKLVRELRELLTEPTDEGATLLARLFPVVHPDDPEAEEEYQRLMREELVASKVAAFDVVDAALAEHAVERGATDDGEFGGARVDAGQLVAFMQALNSIRLVLGTMLGVSDEGRRPVSRAMARRPEYSLYEYLSFLLEVSVRAMRGTV
jgi:hypothetical protein